MSDDDGNPFGRDLADDNPLKGAVKCPHCGGLAKTSPHPELGAICNICGAPRVGVKSVELSGRERAPLEAARNALRTRTLWRVGALFGTVVAAFGLAVAALVAVVAGLSSAFGGVAMVLPWVILALVARQKAKGETKNLTRALDDAWISAARDVVVQSEGVTASGIGEALGLEESKAEELLAELSVDDELRSRVTEDGRLVLAPSTMVRIDAKATGAGKTVAADATDPLEERFAALEEAMAAEEAEEGKQRTKN